MIPASFYTDAEALCRTVAAADLGEIPVYVVDSDAMMQALCGCEASRGTEGFTHPYLVHTPAMRDLLADRWQGPGVLIITSGASIEDNYPPDMLWDGFLSLVLHELGHAIELEKFLPALRAGVVPSNDDVNLTVFAVATGFNAKIKRQSDGSDLAQYIRFHERNEGMHPDSFVRIACHLAYRAKLLAGLDVPIGAVIGWTRRGAYRYLEALTQPIEQARGCRSKMSARTWRG